MRNKAFYLVVLAIVLIFVAGCSGYREVKIGNFRNLELKGMENNILSLEITIPVENPNPYKVHIKAMDLKVMSGKSELGLVTLTEGVTIAKKSSKDYVFRVKVELADLKSSIMSVYRVFRNKSELRLSGKVKVRSFFYYRTINIEDYQLVN